MGEHITAERLRALLDEAGLPGATVRALSDDSGWEVEGDILLWPGSVAPPAQLAGFAEKVTARHDAAARVLGLPSAAEVRAMQAECDTLKETARRFCAFCEALADIVGEPSESSENMLHGAVLAMARREAALREALRRIAVARGLSPDTRADDVADFVESEAGCAACCAEISAQAEVERLRAQVEAAWAATGVAATVRGLTTLEDVVAVTKGDLTAAIAYVGQMKAEVERLRAQLAGSDWYSYNADEGYSHHATEAEARAAAAAALSEYRDEDRGGEWNPDVTSIEYGRIVPVERATEVDVVETPNGPYDFICDYMLKEVPRG